MKLNWWEKDPHAISGTPFDSLTEPQVRRIVEMTAEVEGMTFEGAQALLVERWEADALRAEAQGLSTWKLWARLGRIAAGLVLVLAMAQPAQARTAWTIGFTVDTERATNVVVRWRVECSTATASAGARGRFVGNTPLERHIPQTLPDATHCEIHVAAWDRRPWVAPHHGQRPVVTTWVAGSGKDGR